MSKEEMGSIMFFLPSLQQVYAYIFIAVFCEASTLLGIVSACKIN
jgi:hypothetical protein